MDKWKLGSNLHKYRWVFVCAWCSGSERLETIRYSIRKYAAKTTLLWIRFKLAIYFSHMHTITEATGAVSLGHVRLRGDQYSAENSWHASLERIPQLGGPRCLLEWSILALCLACVCQVVETLKHCIVRRPVKLFKAPPNTLYGTR